MFKQFRFLSIGLFGLISLCLCVSSCATQEKEFVPQVTTPLDCVKGWMDAIRAGDIERADAYLSRRARTVSFYGGSQDALEFWQGEIAGSENSLDADGFKGEWEIQTTFVSGGEVAFAHPLMPDGPHPEAIWVIQQDDSWRIAVLFRRPPEP